MKMKHKAKKKDYKNKILLEINYFKYIYLLSLIIKACMIKLPVRSWGTFSNPQNSSRIPIPPTYQKRVLLVRYQKCISLRARDLYAKILSFPKPNFSLQTIWKDVIVLHFFGLGRICPSTLLSIKWHLTWHSTTCHN